MLNRLKQLFNFCSLLGLLTVAACSGRTTIEDVAIPRDVETVARGKELVKGLAACGFCHGENASPNSVLSGGRVFYDSLGGVYASNLTPAKTGLAGWSYRDIARAVRHSQGKKSSEEAEEVELSVAAHEGYSWLSDVDLSAIVSYLKTLAPIENEVPRREFSFLDNGKKLLFERSVEELGYIPAISPRYQQQYGAYLVEHVGRCILCHNSPKTFFGGGEYLVGGSMVKTAAGEKLAPSITGADETGLGSWSIESIVQYLKTGQTPQGEVVDAQFCPVEFFANASETDLTAIAKYLKSVGHTE